MDLRRFGVGSREAKKRVDQDALAGVAIRDFSEDVMILTHLIFQAGLSESRSSATPREDVACEQFIAWIKHSATRTEPSDHTGVSVTYSKMRKGVCFEFAGNKYWVPGKTRLSNSAQDVMAFYERVWGQAKTVTILSSKDLDFTKCPFSSLERALQYSGALKPGQRIGRAPRDFLLNLPQVAVKIGDAFRPAVVLRVYREHGEDRLVIARPAPTNCQYRDGLPHPDEFGTYLPMRKGLGPSTFKGNQLLEVQREDVAWKTWGSWHTKSTLPLRIEAVKASQCYPFIPMDSPDHYLIGRQGGIITAALKELEHFERFDGENWLESEAEMINWGFVDHWGLPPNLVSQRSGLSAMFCAWMDEFRGGPPRSHGKWFLANADGPVLE